MTKNIAKEWITINIITIYFLLLLYLISMYYSYVTKSIRKLKIRNMAYIYYYFITFIKYHLKY